MTEKETGRLTRDFLLDGVAAPREVACADAILPDAERMPCVVVIGAFDGMHRGHRDLIARATADARARGVATVAITFDPDPDCVVGTRPAFKLLSTEDRVSALARSGVDRVLVVPFDRQVAALDHDAFFTRYMLGAYDVRAVHVGADFRLGAGGRSTVAVMREWGAGRGIEVAGHELLCHEGSPITATRIRALVAAGELDAVERTLGRRYFVRGTVVKGRQTGASLGFPTANIELGPLVQRPAAGVYAGFAFDGRRAWPAAINVGVPPTFRAERAAAELEANILGFSQDIYGRSLALLFTRFLRPQRAFGSLDELVRTVKGNIEEVRALYGDHPVVLAP